MKQIKKSDLVNVIEPDGTKKNAKVVYVQDSNDPNATINLRVVGEKEDRMNVVNESRKVPDAAYWRAK